MMRAAATDLPTESFSALFLGGGLSGGSESFSALFLGGGGGQAAAAEATDTTPGDESDTTPGDESVSTSGDKVFGSQPLDGRLGGGGGVE